MSSSSVPSRIRAVMQEDLQSTDLTLTEMDTPTAKPGTGEHLIRVHATSPCAGELTWAKNFPFVLKEGKEGVPCYDLAGVVVTAPPDSPFQPGAEIYTRTSAMRTGNAREYTLALTSELALKPKNIGWEDAASVPLSAFTAYQALFVHGGLTPPWKNNSKAAENASKRILVTAAAGGVGVWIIQLAKAAGVKDVIAVVGPKNVEFVKELGATEVINYREQSIAQWCTMDKARVDLIIDAVGGQTLADCWQAVKAGGILLSINEAPDSRKPRDAPNDVKNLFFIMNSDGWQLKEVASLIEQGLAKPVVDSVYDLENFQQAFDKVASGHSRGKVIIKL